MLTAEPSLTGSHVLEILQNLAAALGLSSLLAFRPWQRFTRREPVSPETAQTQVLIAVAAAVALAIIGDSMARAFGLVGLGGIVRFRSGLKDPRDAAVLFVMIGIGMGCGLGLLPMAAITTAFLAIVLFALDRYAPQRTRRQRVLYTLTRDPAAPGAETPLTTLRRLYPTARVVSAPVDAPGVQRILLDLVLDADTDAATLTDAARAAGLAGLTEVKLSDD